jgi:hypothetical protein
MTMVHQDLEVRSMLTEPEVLHVVTQYTMMFQALYAGYAGKSPMTEDQFVEFLTDFRIVPELLSRENCRRIFRTCECQDPRTREVVHVPADLAAAIAKKYYNPKPKSEVVQQKFKAAALLAKGSKDGSGLVGAALAAAAKKPALPRGATFDESTLRKESHMSDMTTVSDADSSVTPKATPKAAGSRPQIPSKMVPGMLVDLGSIMMQVEQPTNFFFAPAQERKGRRGTSASDRRSTVGASRAGSSSGDSPQRRSRGNSGENLSSSRH